MGNGGGCRHPQRLSGQSTLAYKITNSQNPHHGFFAGFGDHGDLHTAFLNVHDVLAGIALGEESLVSPELRNGSRQACRIEKGFGVERARLFLSVCWFAGFHMALLRSVRPTRLPGSALHGRAPRVRDKSDWSRSLEALG